jgi:hypothetical protein
MRQASVYLPTVFHIEPKLLYPELPKNKSLPALSLLLGTIDFSTKSDGKVDMFDNCKATTDPSPNDFLELHRDQPAGDELGAKALCNLPWSVASSAIDGFDPNGLSDLPGYFKPQ